MSNAWDDFLAASYARGVEKRTKIAVEIPKVEQEFRRGVDSTGRDRNFRIANKTYVIRCGNFVKIGIANNIAERLRTLEAYNPHPLSVLAVLAGGRPVERSLHLRFAAYRHRDEWFREEGELAEWIKEGCPL